jgi:hypothetical protein
MQTMIRRPRTRVVVSLCVLLAGIGGTVGCTSQEKTAPMPPAATNAGTAGGVATTGAKGPMTAGPVQNVGGQQVQKGPATDP